MILIFICILQRFLENLSRKLKKHARIMKKFAKNCQLPLNFFRLRYIYNNRLRTSQARDFNIIAYFKSLGGEEDA